MPCVYDDFIGTEEQVLTKQHKDALRGMLHFTFKRHPKYNLPIGRLRLIEIEIRRRVRLLLEE